MQRAEFDRARSLAQSVDLPESVKKRVLEAARRGAPELVEGTGPTAGDSTACEGAGMSSETAMGGTTGEGACLPSKLGQQVPISYRGSGEMEEPPMKRAGRRRMPRRFAIVASLCSVALAGTVAYAAIETDFFATVFGDRGHEDVAEHEVTFYSKDGADSFTEYSPARSWYENDPSLTESLVGDCVQEVNESVTVGDYTMTLESLVMDENDIGVASFVVTSPKGFEYTTSEDGGPVLSDDCAFKGIGLDWEEDRWTNYRTEINEALSTSAELHLIVHFDANPDGKSLTRLTWRMSVRNGDEAQEGTLVVEPSEKRVKTVRCVSPDSDLVIYVSPFGYVIDQSNASEQVRELMDEKLAFTMKDGSELLGFEEGKVEGYGYRLTTYNLYFSTSPQDHMSVRGVPAFFINVDELASVTVSFLMDEDENGNRASTGGIVFYPEDGSAGGNAD